MYVERFGFDSGVLSKRTPTEETVRPRAPDWRSRFLSPNAAPGKPQRDLKPRRGSGRHFLFVTCPFGPFSSMLAHRLLAAGARCTRVLLNGGDVLDWGLKHAVLYRGTHEGWAAWIGDFIRCRGVSDLVVFGDCHLYAAEAIACARRSGVRVHVMEEGYFRPNWITIEPDGVNGNSRLPRDPDLYRQAAADGCVPAHDEHALGADIPDLTRRIIGYYAGYYLGFPVFRRYRSPYGYSIRRQGLAHLRRFSGRLMRRARQTTPQPGPYFLVLLQRPATASCCAIHPSRRSPR